VLMQVAFESLSPSPLLHSWIFVPRWYNTQSYDHSIHIRSDNFHELYLLQ